MRLADLGERRVVDALLRVFHGDDALPLGDDCGAVPWGDDYLLATTDAMNEATHMPPGATADRLGWHLVAINLSDLAAMGGTPLGFLASLSVPRGTDLAFLQSLAKGMDDACRAFGLVVLGGDTKEADRMSLAGTALGRVAQDEILLRRGARPGDRLVVTGEVGRGGWAETHLAASGEEGERALEWLLRPTPRLAEGRLLATSGAATSCMDVSDGVAATLAQMAAASGVRFAVDWDALPLAAPLRGLPPEEARDVVLYRGGDYELLATVAAEGLEDVLAAARARGLALTPVGDVLPGTGGNVLRGSGKDAVLEDRGYEHFRSDG
jgi:thiamine-monophosphate kinase